VSVLRGRSNDCIHIIRELRRCRAKTEKQKNPQLLEIYLYLLLDKEDHGAKYARDKKLQVYF